MFRQRRKSDSTCGPPKTMPMICNNAQLRGELNRRTMKVAELRATLKKHSKDQLELLVVELYKAMPKALKEERDIDRLVLCPDAEQVKRIKSSRKEDLDFDSVADEARAFIDYASRQYYFAPNMYVAKKERPKWRFIAKRLFRSLVQCAADPENLEPAADLVEQLYMLLCKAYGVVLFSTEDPFASVGIPQVEFLRQTLALRNRHMDKDQFVRKAVALAAIGSASRWLCTTDIFFVILEFLTIPDLKLRAIAAAEELIAERQRAYRAERADYKKYYIRDAINNLSRFAFHCYAQLDEFEEGIKFFNTHYIERDEEVKLYIVVQALHSFYDQPEIILDQITKAMAKGVRPRRELMELAKSIEDSLKETNPR